MKKYLIPVCAAVAASLITTASMAATPCGGSFSSFIKGLKSEAAKNGHSKAELDRFFTSAQIDPKVLRFDRSQSNFRQSFMEFSGRTVSKNRMDHGRINKKKYKTTFARAQRDYGVDPNVLLAFWAMETDYGANQGDFNTLNSLVTLAHDCRRPELFRPQVIAAVDLWKRGTFDPATTTGAWAGEIGMVQMLPEDILHRGIDGDGDGRVTLKTSAPDAILTGARLLRDLGWRAGEPWMVEVAVPKNLDWSQTGLGKPQTVSKWKAKGVKARSVALPNGKMPASLLLPQGRKGPAFLVFDNFNVYFEWNKSLVYVTSAAYFATRLAGAAPYTKGNPDPTLSADQMVALQKKLKRRGHDVGKVDGILGAKTRAAVAKEQKRLGLPADAWPTAALLKAL
jgi:lytic murein transglycosylase